MVQVPGNTLELGVPLFDVLSAAATNACILAILASFAWQLQEASLIPRTHVFFSKHF